MDRYRLIGYRKITSVGASTGVSLPAHHLKECGLEKGKTALVYIDGKKIVLSAVSLNGKKK